MKVRGIVCFGLVLSFMLPSVGIANSRQVESEGGPVLETVLSFDMLSDSVNEASEVAIKDPKWLVTRSGGEVTYTVITRGAITANVDEFKSQANQTLNDKRGWSQLGVSFREVGSGGQFILALVEAAQVPSFSSFCSSEYSCRVGQYVVINQDRWLGATSSWNNSGGSLRDYRHMVVNHEVGHWLGHGHSNCSGTGQPASVMQQQSIDLQGCSFNPWPLRGELWSSQLGI